MDFRLTEEQLMIQKAAREFAQQQCLPGVIERDELQKFPKKQIEQLADMILESEGVLNVILLTQTGINSYNVLVGDLEYYAAVRAKEKNPRQGEMINAVIVQPSNQEILLKQAEFFTVKPEEVKVI